MTAPLVGVNAVAWPMQSGGWLIEANGAQPFWVPNRTAARRELNVRALQDRPLLAGEADARLDAAAVTATREAPPRVAARRGAGDYFPPT
ncbi:hypothetical protein [Micromonospora sediminicola]|uniref:hypothetical protein n=1 Tax=Micromonospora sediminicola TaxID=946078 RepID=UPI00379A7D41